MGVAVYYIFEIGEKGLVVIVGPYIAPTRTTALAKTNFSSKILALLSENKIEISTLRLEEIKIPTPRLFVLELWMNL
jgi:hypothetical protein